MLEKRWEYNMVVHQLFMVCCHCNEIYPDELTIPAKLSRVGEAMLGSGIDQTEGDRSYHQGEKEVYAGDVNRRVSFKVMHKITLFSG